MKSIIVSEYLSSLKEDSELDYIFPLLLMAMQYKIITTPKEYKGYSQYGKDIIASGTDPLDGVRKLFYFELKGGKDKHITSHTFSKKDGIRESLYEAKDSQFEDPSLLDTLILPRKIILVHNGVLKPDVKSTFDGFIKNNFKQTKQNIFNRLLAPFIKEKNIEFERWDINRLTELFEEHLFNEYLLTDDNALKYFKGFLSLFCTPEYNNSHFYYLINHILPDNGTEHTNPNSRGAELMFETLKVVCFIVINISKDNNNLLQAVRLLHFVVLKLWGEILLKEWNTTIRILRQFESVYELFKAVLKEFYEKTIDVAKLKNGLYFDAGGRFGIVGAPILSFEFISYMYIHFSISNNKDNILNDIISVITKNTSCYRPIIDAHSIPIVSIILALLKHDKENISREYLGEIMNYLALWRKQTNLIPEGRNNIDNVVEYYGLGFKPPTYENKTSQLLGCLFELLAKLNMKDHYDKYKPIFDDIDLCVFVPYTKEEYDKYQDDEFRSEVNLFQKGLYNEGYQSGISLDEDFVEFKEKTEAKNEMIINLETLKTEYPELLFMAQYGHNTPMFPFQWR